MSKLQELIDHLCPNGVEFKPLGEVCDFVNGFAFKSNLFRSKGERIIRITNITGSNVDVMDSKYFELNDYSTDLSKYRVQKGNILIAMSGATTGKIGCYNSNENSYINQRVGMFKPHDELSERFLFHFLSTITTELYILAGGGAQPNLSSNQLMSDVRIPIPPIEVQDEIVKILDRFSDYAAELQAELQARRLQYEYYRNLLLTFNSSAYGCGTDDAQKISVIARGGHSYEIQWKTMGEIGKFFGGLTGKSKADFSNGNARFISYMNVYSNIALDQSANEFVSILPDEKQNVLQYGDALFTGSSETPNECGMSSVVTTEPKEPLYLNSFSFGFRLDNISTYHPDFLKHLLRSTAIRDQIAKTANGVTRFNVSKALFAKIILPIPPIELQVKIASILDRFETLVNDLSKGLPAEIEAVKARYEYYRNKLLTFNPLSA